MNFLILRLRVLIAVLAIAVVASGMAASKGAGCELPKFGSVEIKEVFSTRASIEVLAIISNTNEPHATWYVEYIQLAALEEAETHKEQPAWILSAEELNFSSSVKPALGLFDEAAGRRVQHHLSPSTAYLARFRVVSECGEAELEEEFATQPVGKPEVVGFRLSSLTPRSAGFTAQVESNGAATSYEFEFAPAVVVAGSVVPGEWKAFSSGASGTATVAEDFVDSKASVSGLEPESLYFARLRANNGVPPETIEKEFIWPGHFGRVESFETPTGKPVVLQLEARNVTAATARAGAAVDPNGGETRWRFEYIATQALEEAEQKKVEAEWVGIVGGKGVISTGEAEETPEGGPFPRAEASLSGLAASTSYLVRLVTENSCASGCGAGVVKTVEFKTSGAPEASTWPVHGLHGGTVRLLGSVNPRSVATSAEETVIVEGGPSGGTFTLSFEGHTTAPIAWNASANSVQSAIKEAIPSLQDVTVGGRDSGPYTVYFGGSSAGVVQPVLTGNGSGLTPSGSVKVVVAQAGGEACDARSWFEYVSLHDFETTGWEKAMLTPVEDIGVGESAQYVGADLLGLIVGEDYRYRIVAASSCPFPEVHGRDAAFLAPTTPMVLAGGACPNQSLRTGVSANLPDCRGYEQVTPVDKEGSQEIFRYDGVAVKAGTAVGEGGAEHGYGVMLDAPQVNWGPGAGAGQSPFFFSRKSAGWSMIAGQPQPEAGVSTYEVQVLSADLSLVGFRVEYKFSPGAGESKEVTFVYGRSGGPYTKVASVPRSKVGSERDGLVGAAEDFSKLVLQVEDHGLVSPKTTTTSGDDLYEYSGGKLAQVNVGVGSCGATIANGSGERPEIGQQTSSRGAVSRDGSVVFFEAVPGNVCSAASHVYIRRNGGTASAETVDLGAYQFVAANRDGSVVFLEKQSGENPGLYVYRMESGGSARLLKSSSNVVGAKLAVSEDMSTVYIVTSGEVYRYDVATETLEFMFATGGSNYFVSPDGRFFIFTATGVGDMPAGATVKGCGHETDHELVGECPTPQVFRYDSVEHVVECVSCSSSYAEEPKLGSYFGKPGPSGGQYEAPTGTPHLVLASANGDFVFFQTPADLIPSDVDGEVIPEGQGGVGLEHASLEESVSSDIYEWRAPGINGCALVQGCLALITNGRGGLENLVLGATPSGSDVFIYTHSQLVIQDNDQAGDIYDVRIDGGEPPPPPPPVDCENSACSTPATPPVDATPGSFTFTGPGNYTPEQKTKPHKARKHRKIGRRKRKRSLGHKPMTHR
jgi:hypothetical protein